MNHSKIFSQVLAGLLLTLAADPLNARSPAANPAIVKESPEESLKRAIKAIDDGQPDSAAEILKSFKADGKLEALRLFHLARAAARLKDYERALKNVEKAVQLDADLHVARYNTACYQSLAGRPGQAETTLLALAGYLETQKVEPSVWYKYIQLLEKDADLAKLRRSAGFSGLLEIFERGKLTGTIRSPVSAKTGINVSGCGKVDANGKVLEVACENFDGATFHKCETLGKGWVRITKVELPEHAERLSQCIYEL